MIDDGFPSFFGLGWPELIWALFWVTGVGVGIVLGSVTKVPQ